MDVTKLDHGDLRVSTLLALDFLTAHRISHDRTYDLAKITAARDALEQRVLFALSETDESEMPEGWSWMHAAHEISIRIALSIVEEEKS
ncbi:hypothetical protein [Hydrogenophaga sp. 2FB]|uniref:hypothetical protein n=1 Tax=Hydrogenophaga sp. 2FB TaxID=2502187 RepID=UPI0010F6F00A|nr:hypothetical protein [Hydrogenophaga sp. 2FB]